MRPFRDIPIQRKLRVVILAVCSAALIAACGVLFGMQYLLFKRDFERDLSALAEIIANNSTTALALEDENTAAQILASLKAKPHIPSAALILPTGQALAQLGPAELPEQSLKHLKAGLQPLGNGLVFVRPVMRDGLRLGTLLLFPDYQRQMNELFRLYASILAAALLTSLLVAAFVSWRLEKVILGPIRYLAQISHRIASRHDYSLRAQKMVDDEIGSFTESFNSMLDQIEHRDQALRHEIAERVRAEEEAQVLHEKLIDASRQSGMAEVATGVLHNVGNVLNSVNVSATLVAEKLGRSRTENLVRATTLLREQNGHLAEFLNTDEKGRLLPRYLAEVSAQLAEERTAALAEVDLLVSNIAHIKEIVAMQQSYAKVGGFIEPLSLAQLIDDALRMNAASFERHGMQVECDYALVPEAAVDKHKMLQILLNIMRNAKYAMDAAEGLSEKRLTISLRERPGRLAEVRLTDCGIGIAPEQLTRIFAHGFTTRKDGHGFGLHSAALAAQQMGGRLSAESAGLGQGATFILELPLAQPWAHPSPTPA